MDTTEKHYHQRSNAESVFSIMKAKFLDNVRSKCDVAMKNEVLCKIFAQNICVLIQEQCELGIEPIFWQDAVEEKVIEAVVELAESDCYALAPMN